LNIVKKTENSMQYKVTRPDVVSMFLELYEFHLPKSTKETSL
jgi:hypothetical protein